MTWHTYIHNIGTNGTPYKTHTYTRNKKKDIINQLNWNINSGPPEEKLKWCPLRPPPIPPNPIPSNPPNMLANMEDGSKSAGEYTTINSPQSSHPILTHPPTFSNTHPFLGLQDHSPDHIDFSSWNLRAHCMLHWLPWKSSLPLLVSRAQLMHDDLQRKNDITVQSHNFVPAKCSKVSAYWSVYTRGDSHSIRIIVRNKYQSRMLLITFGMSL